MRNDTKMVVALTLIACIASMLLAFIHEATSDVIAEAYRKEFMAGLDAVMNEYDNEPDNNTLEFEGRKIYVGLNGSEPVGYAVKSSTKKGYGGEITVLVGVNTYGRITGVQVLKHSETPGLGDKILNENWRDSFKGLSVIDGERISIKRDGGYIDQFSGATISPRAVAGAVREAVEFIAFHALEEADNETE